MKKSFLTYLFLTFAMSAAAVTVNVHPGQLADLLSANNPAGSLVIRGQADARDLSVLRGLEGVDLLDLGATSISAIETENPVITGRSVFKADH
ncbi:MAG: hypothetical protein K2J15_03065, partial [Muribaculaceae bacterium]|nr:hypothetical protein [Muribaculaceae bacterium]